MPRVYILFAASISCENSLSYMGTWVRTIHNEYSNDYWIINDQYHLDEGTT